MELRSCAFTGNGAWGGLCNDPYNNPVSAVGGAIDNEGTLSVDLCTFTGNSAAGDAGVLVSGYSCQGGFGGGGAILTGTSLLTVDRSTFRGNVATGGDGASGILFPYGVPGGNAGGGAGGAIYGPGSVWRSLLVSNVVTGGRGGDNGCFRPSRPQNGGVGGDALGAAVYAGATLVNCTVAFNAADGGAGGAGNPPGAGGWADGGVVCVGSAVNCTIASNLAQGNGASVGTGASSVNTLIASNTPAGGDTFADPKLGPLTNNGGPTLTMALLPGSPAIDAGNTALAPATDQRGFPRPAGLAADIGAFEYGSVMPAILVNRSGATGLTILASGNANQSCRLLSSVDLATWVPIATNCIGSGGTVLFNDTCAPGDACRFYRLVMP